MRELSHTMFAWHGYQQITKKLNSFFRIFEKKLFRFLINDVLRQQPKYLVCQGFSLIQCKNSEIIIFGSLLISFYTTLLEAACSLAENGFSIKSKLPHGQIKPVQIRETL